MDYNRSPADVRLRRAEDVLVLALHMLEFEPDRVVVVLGFHGPVFVGGWWRRLPADADPTSIRRMVEKVTVRCAHDPVVDTLEVIGYGPPQPVATVAAAMAELCDTHRLRLRHMWRVTGDRYYQLHPAQGASPAHGRVYDPASNALAADITLTGLHVVPALSAAVAQVTPVTGPARQAMRQATNTVLDELGQLYQQTTRAGTDTVLRAAGIDAVRDAFTRLRQPLADAQAARLCLLLQMHPTVYCYAWAATDRDQAHLELWADLTRRAEPLVAPPAALCGWAAWRRGNRPLANLAVQRALHHDPDDFLATRVRGLLDHAVTRRLFDDWPTVASARIQAAGLPPLAS